MPFMARYDPFSPTLDHPLLNSSPDFSSRNGTFSNRQPFGALGAANNLSFRERIKRIQDIDAEKNQLIEDLLFQLESTQDQVRKLQYDSQATREYKLRETSLQDQLRQNKELMDRNAFIIALIDGDGSLFTKDLLSKGEKGGKEAATLLAAAMDSYIAEALPHISSPKVLVRICMNMSLLTEVLVKSRYIDKAASMQDFIRGFNSTKALFEFVDAGNKKDAAGDKICELLRLNLYDCHCHQVLFACSNKEYTLVLDEVSKDEPVMDHLTLLETIPFDVGGLQHRFKTTRFDSIFSTIRPTMPIVTPKPPPNLMAALPVLTKVESNKTNGNSSSSSTPAMNWATVTAQAQANLPPPPALLKATTNGANATASTRSVTPASAASGVASKPIKGKLIETNRAGHRIDRVDDSIANYEIQRVKKLKLCNIYYLQSPDLCTSSSCTHRHDYPISNSERKTLREVARMTPCYYKLDCDDPECIYGHRCPQSEVGKYGCYYGEDCRFYGWGHGIDTRVVKTVKV